MNGLIETGIKAVDLYAPLPRGGRLAIRGERGTGQAVVTFEIVHNVCTHTKATAHFFVEDDTEQFRRGLRESGVEAEVSPSDRATYAELRKDGSVLGTIVIGDDPEADSWIMLSRDLLKSGQLPAVDATQSGTRLELGAHSELAAQPGSRWRKATWLAPRCSPSCGSGSQSPSRGPVSRGST